MKRTSDSAGRPRSGRSPGRRASPSSPVPGRSGWNRATTLLATATLLTAILVIGWVWRARSLDPQPWSASDQERIAGCNVLLVSLDTTRPDWLAACGGGPVATPALDRLAGHGFRFGEMTTPAPITLPAHASLFTAWDPPRHGVRENTEYALPEKIPTLAEAFANAGYETGAVVSSFVLDGRFGLSRGFASYDDRLAGPEPGLHAGTVELPGSIVAERASAWIQRYAANRARAGQSARPSATPSATSSATSARPFFLFVHFFDAHAPYSPPAAHRALYPGDAYAGELSYQDACLGQVLDTLENTGLAENTLVWVVSDHGESLGEHGEATHSLFIYDATLRVVSILAPPASSGRWESATPRLDIDAACSLVDVPPTLCALLGIEAPQFAVERADGRDLTPLLRATEVSMETRAVYAESWSPYVSYHWAPLQGMRTTAQKYILAPIPELYDLQVDAKELNNLAAARPTAREVLETALDGHLQRIRLAPPADGDLVSQPDGSLDGSLDGDLDGDRDGDPASPGSISRRRASPEEVERLRSLGYLAGSSGERTTTGGAGPETDLRSLPDPKRMLGFFHDQFQQAKSFLLAGRYDDAIAAFAEARRIDPGNTSVHLFLAGALRQAGRHSEASGSYRDALRLAPGSPRAWFGLGRSLLLESKPDSAVTAFARALELLPESPDHWMGLGEAEYARGAYRPALDAFRASLERGGPETWLHGVIARICLEHLDDPVAGDPHLRAFATQSGLTPDAARSSLPTP